MAQFLIMYKKNDIATDNIVCKKVFFSFFFEKVCRRGERRLAKSLKSILFVFCNRIHNNYNTTIIPSY